LSSTTATTIADIAKADTTTTITNASSLASTSTVVGQSYTVNWLVSVNSPGAGTPTGTVAVTGGSGCSAAVSAGSCTVTSTTAGAKTLVAIYTSDTANLNGSTSAGASHTVNSATTTTVVQNTSTPYSDVAQFITLTATISATYAQVNGGTATFTVTDSSNVTIGSPAVSGTVAVGNASANYSLPGGTSAATYTITAVYSGTADFTGSSVTGTLTVNPSDLQSDTATLDADFKKIDGFDVLFNKIDKSTLLKLENTNPGTFHYRLRMTNLTGADLNSDNGNTVRAFIEVPAMVDCGGVPCASTVSTTLPAFSLRNKKAVRVRPDDKTDDMPVVYSYSSTPTGSCSLATYSTTFPTDESPRCIMVSGFALPKKHRAEVDLTFEFRWKKTLNWSADSSLWFFSGFPFKATVQAIFTSPGVTRTGYFTVGLVGAGQRVTAVGGFSFNGLAQPTTGLIVRLFDSTKPVAACGTTTNLVAQDTVNADGFYFIWRKGTDQGTAGANDLPDGVKYIIQICNGNTQVGTLRTLTNKLGKKEFDEEDFYGVMWP
jgi:Bacterial Ig-like domain (group 3)